MYNIVLYYSRTLNYKSPAKAATLTVVKKGKFADHGGECISVPVTYFNDGWGKKRFARPNHTFLVALCLSSCTGTKRHSMRVLYDVKSSTFELTEGVFKQYHLLWLSHRKPSEPVYEMTSQNPVDDAIAFLCQFLPDPKQRKRMHKSRRGLKNDPFAEYRLDLDVLDTPRDISRRLSLKGQGKSPDEFTRRFGEVLNNVISLRAGFRWLRNSCHLDVWLMEEFSIFSTMCSTDAGSLLLLSMVDGPAKDMGMLRLVNVLLALGTAKQQQYKVAYWLMEIEMYKASMKMWGMSMCTEHAVLLTENSNCRDDSVHVACTIQCSSICHRDKAVIGKKTVNASDEWYSVPAEYMRTEVGMTEEGKKIWDHTGDYGRNPHDGVEDVMQTLLARSDRRKAACKECADMNIEPRPFLVSIKTPLLAKLPKFLRVDANRGTAIQPEQIFSIGGWTYDLCSVIFGNNSHFQSNVMLKGDWYHYDGLGIKPGGEHRLKKMYEDKEDYWCPFTSGYEPVSYRYVRFDPLEPSMEHVLPLNDIADFKANEFQYESMHSVLDAEDHVLQGGTVIDVTVS